MTDFTLMLAERLASLRARIEAVCRSAGRSVNEITLIAVTKSIGAAEAAEAVAAGLGELGESRPQELLRKRETLASGGLAPNWHLIGSLQRNKVRAVLPGTALLHSVDSVRLAETVSRIAGELGLTTHALLQVNLSGEAAKQGFSAEELGQALPRLAALPHVRWRGLMTMAPLGAGAAACEALFARTRALHGECRTRLASVGFDILSMGMSDDFEAAIRAGATHIRIGRGLFGTN